MLEPVVSADTILESIQACRDVFVHEAIEGYIIALAKATRHDDALMLGASPRGTLALYHTSQALAALRGRAFVIPDDVQDLVEPVLAHRLIPSTKMRLRGDTIRGILRRIVATVPVPVEENWAEGAAA
jgi:MoxR-like ATPase